MGLALIGERAYLLIITYGYFVFPFDGPYLTVQTRLHSGSL